MSYLGGVYTSPCDDWTYLPRSLSLLFLRRHSPNLGTKLSTRLDEWMVTRNYTIVRIRSLPKKRWTTCSFCGLSEHPGIGRWRRWRSVTNWLQFLNRPKKSTMSSLTSKVHSRLPCEHLQDPELGVAEQKANSRVPENSEAIRGTSPCTSNSFRQGFITEVLRSLLSSHVDFRWRGFTVWEEPRWANILPVIHLEIWERGGTKVCREQQKDGRRGMKLMLVESLWQQHGCGSCQPNPHQEVFTFPWRRSTHPTFLWFQSWKGGEGEQGRRPLAEGEAGSGSLAAWHDCSFHRCIPFKGITHLAASACRACTAQFCKNTMVLLHHTD